MRDELTDDEWTAIKPMLPNKPRDVPRVNDRRVLSGIFRVLRSGAPWRDLPGEGRNNARAGHGGPPTRGLDFLRTSVTKEGVFPVELNGGPAIGTSRQAGTMARAASAPAARNYFHSLDSYSR